ncbi:hypothetical protein [Myxosarcina sp. GI1]|nr:hypothetical protein [Myxosarcina sp. GI1]
MKKRKNKESSIDYDKRSTADKSQKYTEQDKKEHEAFLKRISDPNIV